MATTLAVGGAPLPPPTLAAALALAASGVVLAGRAPALAAGLLGIAAAPAWLLGVGVVAVPGAPVPGAAAAGLLVLALGLAPLAPGALPRGARLALLGLGLALGARAALVAGQTPGAPPAAGALVLGATVVAGAGSLPRRGLAGAGALLLAVLLVRLGLAWGPWTRPPASTTEVARAVAVGALSRHAAPLAARPDLGLHGLALRPQAHEVALALAPVVGPETLLDAGWRPEGAPLAPALRWELAASLDRRGRGGEALRLAWAGRGDAAVAWAWLLLARDQGRHGADQAPPADLPLAPPADVLRLPGRVTLDWAFLSPGARLAELHLDQPVPSLVLQVRGQSWQGPAALHVQVDATPPRTVDLPDGPGSVTVPGPWAAGPHRLRVRFENDASGPDGDRNAWVDAVQSGGAVGQSSVDPVGSSPVQSR